MVAGNRVIEPSSKGAVQRFNRSFELLEPLPEKAQKILAVLGADGVASEAVRYPVAYDSGKRLAVSAVEFPVVLANLEAKLDALYGQFERLTAANERLTDMMLGRVADLEEPDSVEVVEGQKKLGDYVR